MELRLQLYPVILLTAFGFQAAHAQTQDTSGNALLSGSFHFRHVAVQNIDSNNNPSEVTATSGVITFDGKGKYTLTGSSVDNTVANGTPQALNTSGTYAIGSNGTGYIANPLSPADPFFYIYGAVAQGVFTGSSTEVGDEMGLLNDIFVAIPSGTAPTNAQFTSTYQVGLLDFTGGGSTSIKNALFALAPNGKGGFGTISLTGQASDQSAPTINQSITGATYNFNGDGSANLTIPPPTGVSTANALFTGSKTMFVSADGNFIVGWTSSGYDVFFGVKALNGNGSNSISLGLYFNAGLEDSTQGFGVDSFYGSINNSGDSTGDGILHERLNYPFGYSFDYGTDDQITINADGTTPADLNGYQYIFGDSGKAFVGIGTNGDYALLIGLHAPSFSGPGVYLNPIGIVNAASLAPITASIAPGELIELTGTGLANSNASMMGGQAFPTKLGGVIVTINNIQCPLYFVTPTLIAAIAPYELASNQTGLVNIQVNNNGTLSNVVQMYMNDSAPGAFSANQNGIGLAAAQHVSTGALLTSSNPAQPGETIVLYLTGLGTVSPSVPNGALGPSSPLSYSDLFNAGNLTVYFNDYGANGTAGNQASVAYAGLVPTLAGLYQVNVKVPSSGLAPGDDVYVEFVTDMADVNQIQIPFGGSTGRRVRPARPNFATRRTAGSTNVTRRPRFGTP